MLTGDTLTGIQYINNKHCIDGNELIGLAKVRLAAPPDLYDPLLPICDTSTGDVLYGLCKTCCKLKNRHNDKKISPYCGHGDKYYQIRPIS